MSGPPPRGRCTWAKDPLDIVYHDEEWGVPAHDDRTLFEFLILEGAQAGLSWTTILKKRDGYRRAFAGFDPARVARYTTARAARLLADPAIVRNRAKIEATVANARAFLAVQREHGSFDAYVWGFVGGRPRQNAWRVLKELPAATDESRALSRDLVKRGFRFVGPTICYAFMQAIGIVNDHTIDCFRWREVRRLAKRVWLAERPASAGPPGGAGLCSVPSRVSNGAVPRASPLRANASPGSGCRGPSGR
jgi:DNA-3-methyladenine glycosylase I